MIWENNHNSTNGQTLSLKSKSHKVKIFFRSSTPVEEKPILPQEKPFAPILIKENTNPIDNIESANINKDSNSGVTISVITNVESECIAPKEEEKIIPIKTVPIVEKTISEQMNLTRNYEKKIDDIKKVTPELYKVPTGNVPKKKRKIPVHSFQAKEIWVYENMGISELSISLGIEIGKIEEVLKELEQVAPISRDTAEYVVEFFHHIPKKVLSFNEEIIKHIQSPEEHNKDERNLILTIAGHVDHGKTTLVDSFLGKKELCVLEKGNITQTVCAYAINFKNNNIVLIDTPGHDVFFSARETSIKLCDLVVLVIDLTEGVQVQTKEIILIAKEFNKKMVIAFNKIDHPRKVGKEQIYNDLLKLGVLVAEKGGDVLHTDISALKNINLDGLVGMINIQSLDINRLYDAKREGAGYFLNSHMKRGMGIIGEILITQGSIKREDNVILDDGQTFKIKTLEQVEHGVLYVVSGLPRFITPGERCVIINNDTLRNNIIKKFHIGNVDINAKNPDAIRNMILKGSNMIDLQSLKDAIDIWFKKNELETKPHIVSSSIHEINESDLEIAKNHKAIIVAFKCKVPMKIEKLIKQSNLGLINEEIIYYIKDQMKEVLKKPIETILEEQTVGTAEVKKVFVIDDSSILGCVVKSGEMIKGKKVNIKFKDEILYAGTIISLKREKDDLKTCKTGHECGIKVGGLSSKKTIPIGSMVDCISEVTVEKQQQ